ncbi:MAG: WbqC family protein, partial [Balneolaceae bacterium]
AMIRTPEGRSYLNVPVRTEDRKKPIGDVRMDHAQPWIDTFLRTIEYNYRNSVYYDFYEPEINALVRDAADTDYLVEWSENLRSAILSFMDLECPEQRRCSNGDWCVSDNPDEIANALGASEYVQEPGSKHYMRQGKKAEPCTVEHPVYRQHFDGFEPGCCVLDLLLQYGPESFRVIDQLFDNA